MVLASANEKAGGLAPPGLSQPPPGNRFLQVLVDQLGHLEHRHLRLAAEHRLQLVVGIDHATVLLVLQAIALDVAPDLLGHLGARHGARADDGAERCARVHRLHECRIRLALLARLLRLLFRHRVSPLNGNLEIRIFPPQRGGERKMPVPEEHVNRRTRNPRLYFVARRTRRGVLL
jgi:hypothetical protein